MNGRKNEKKETFRATIQMTHKHRVSSVHWVPLPPYQTLPLKFPSVPASAPAEDANLRPSRLASPSWCRPLELPETHVALPSPCYPGPGSTAALCDAEGALWDVTAWGSPLKLPRWLSGKEPACQSRMSLGWEGSLEKEMAIHSSILAWEIPWTEKPGGLRSLGVSKELDLT